MDTDKASQHPDPLLRITPDDGPSPTPVPRKHVLPPAEDEAPTLLLSVILPIRDEQDVLAACLQSLIAQSEIGFELAQQWELLLVDDSSTDDTPRILADAAAAHPGITVLHAPPLTADSGFTGKNQACWLGAQSARGALLLFTDADTLHEPGSLSRARHELSKYDVALLSYSPRQLTTGLLQRFTMPLIFAELAIAYPPARVNDSADRTAAANGQFLMVERAAYFAVGGHRAIGTRVLEDVALAHNIKRAKNTIRFRYAPDALSTRMYRSTAAMLEGWTKNLALLFPAPIPMALLRLLDLLLLVCIPFIAVLWFFPTDLPRVLLWIVWARVLWRFYARTAKSNFPPLDVALAILGLPVFIFLLARSYLQVRIIKRVTWKDRTYNPTSL